MTKEIMKKERATMPRDSRQVRPMAMMEEANCQVAALRWEVSGFSGGWRVLVVVEVHT